MTELARVASFFLLLVLASGTARAEEGGEAAASARDETPPAPGDGRPRSIHFPPPGGKGSDVRYSIRARVEGQDIEGSVSIEIDPIGDEPVERIVLYLFPNVLSERLAGEDDKSFFTIQPRRFRPGGMRLLSVTAGDGEELPVSDVEMTRPDGKGGEVRLPARTAVAVGLPRPAEGTVRLQIRFRVHVPERFGTFAWYRRDLFLAGGWYPMVAPRDRSGSWDLDGPLPRSDSEVELEGSARRWIILHDRVFAPDAGKSADETRTVSARVEARPSVLLVVSDRLATLKDPAVTVLQPERRKAYARREMRIARQARAFLEAEGLVEKDALPNLLYEAPLTRELVFHDVPIAAVSFRTYRVFPPIMKYHDVHVARAMIAADVRDRIYALEPGEDAGWVLDAAAWHLAKRWEAAKYEDLPDVRDYARPLSFLPAVDLVLNTPDFPFAAEYYDNWYFTDLVRDDVRRFNHLRPNGRVVYEKMADLLGPKTTAAIMDTYLAGQPGGGGFREVAERVSGRDLKGFFETWRGPLPNVNYGIKSVRSRKLPTGRWMTEVTLFREGDAVEEPVEVRVRAPGPDVVGTWDGSGEEGTILLFTRGRPNAVEIDPRNRLLETSRRDNRVPAAWRMLLQYAYVDYEFELNTTEAGFAVQFERSNDLRNQINLAGFHTQQSSGGAVGYSRSMGRFSFYRGLLHRFAVFFLAEDLAKDFARDGLHVVPGFDPARSEVESTAGLQLSYRYDSRTDWRFSRGGTRVFAAVESGTSFEGSSAPYFLAYGDVVKLLRLGDNNVLALQARAGTFFATNPADVPLSKLFFIGGTEDIRGISAPEIVGPTKLVFSMEWRHFLVHDLDWNLYLLRMRGLQGALFVDAGYIAPRTSVIPRLEDWVSDIGYGFREHYDFLGVRPMILRLDFAQRLDNLRDTRKPDIRVYIGAGQSF